MKKLNELEKSKGIIVFAFNTDKVDYVGIADKTSAIACKTLGLPVTLVTDYASTPKFDYDTIIRVENSKSNIRPTINGEIGQWRNFDRYMAYELSPYDETLLVDIDYLILDNSLLKLFETDFDYKLMFNTISPDKQLSTDMGVRSLDFVWATVVLFRKTIKAKLYFDLIGRIQRNYSHYKALYNCLGTYRNDFAFAIANHILNGYDSDKKLGIPWRMITFDDIVESIEFKNNLLIVRESKRCIITPVQNLHIMDKQYLASEKFNNFTQEILNV